jgi:hypothetical protein
MKKLLASALLVLSGLFIAPAYAQTTAPDQPDSGKTRRQKGKDAPTADMARTQRRMSMNPNDAKRDQQLEILEARSGGTANTSFGRGSGPARQYDKGTGGFTVKKFRDKRVGTNRQKRGQGRPAPGIDPKGKPLKHKKRNGFLFSK